MAENSEETATYLCLRTGIRTGTEPLAGGPPANGGETVVSREADGGRYAESL